MGADVKVDSSYSHGARMVMNVPIEKKQQALALLALFVELITIDGVLPHDVGCRTY